MSSINQASWYSKACSSAQFVLDEMCCQHLHPLLCCVLHPYGAQISPLQSSTVQRQCATSQNKEHCWWPEKTKSNKAAVCNMHAAHLSFTLSLWKDGLDDLVVGFQSQRSPYSKSMRQVCMTTHAVQQCSLLVFLNVLLVRLTLSRSIYKPVVSTHDK